MTLLDLFSGIGAFSLGLERAGFKTVAFCEIEDFCRRVLAKHWPDVPIYDDVRHLDAARLRADGITAIDAICGGFPCQDISVAGRGAGLDGERSGLWREYSRLVGELRPQFVIVENVGALRARGLATVLGDLAALGYDARWNVVPAAAVGAHHLRERVWIIAERTGAADRVEDDAADAVADADGAGLRHEQGWRSGASGADSSEPVDDGAAGADANTDSRRRELIGITQHRNEQGTPGPVPDGLGQGGQRNGTASAVAWSQRQPQRGGLQRRLARSLAAVAAPRPWPAEPAFRRVDDGAAKRLDRAALKALGNSVHPDIPEAIGRAILEVAA
jgi:DNA (cytosine-5)-methyltransferase 1